MLTPTPQRVAAPPDNAQAASFPGQELSHPSVTVPCAQLTPQHPDSAPELTTSFTAFFGPSSTTLRPGFRSPRENASCNCRARSASVPGEEGRPSPPSPSHASSADTYLPVCDQRFLRIRVRAGGQGGVHLAARTLREVQHLPEVRAGPGPCGGKRAPSAAAACLQPPTLTPRLHVEENGSSAHYTPQRRTSRSDFRFRSRTFTSGFPLL